LLRHGKTALAKLVSERILVNFLDKFRSERVGDGQRAPDDKPGEIIDSSFICVHLRFHFLRWYWPPKITRTLVDDVLHEALRRCTVRTHPLRGYFWVSPKRR
jgi:hypothetical protein